TESWLSGAPEGSIILGVDPHSCSPADWDGGTASVQLFLADVYSPTVYTIDISWPDQNDKGLHSPIKNQTAFISFDQHPVWSKRTTDSGSNGDYYAIQHPSVLTTIVVTQSITHTLAFSVPVQTAWDLSLIELTASPYPDTIKGIGYSPYRDCQASSGPTYPSSQEIQSDLLRLFHTATAIRTYSVIGVNAQIPALANSTGLPVYAGAWLDYPTTTDAQDDAEIQALINLACTTHLEGAIVGNEYYLRHRSADSITYLLERIQEVKTGILNQCGKSVPVTTAEIDDLMFVWEGDPPISIAKIMPAYKPIIDEVDYVMVHTYPFWSGLPVDGAAALTIDRYKAMRALLAQEYAGQNKWIIIGETGWPSAGGPNGLAQPSLFNQQKYMLEFLPLAEQEKVNFLYFDAYDELWKIEEPGSVGKHWGYSYSDRSAKHSFYSVLLPSEALPLPQASLSNSVYLPRITKSGTDGRMFAVYSEWPEGPGHFVPSGWMGDMSNIAMYECDRCDPHSGELSIRASFSSSGALGWAGVYWQYPENNWGNINAGINLTGAK
ncbi:hypothetical protein EHM76_06190, partial [bacterium]